MFGERCARCFVKADKIRLFDVIYDGKIDLLCERCAIIENIPLIKKPDEAKFNDSDVESVYNRMKKISGIPIEESKRDNLNLERLHELEENPELAEPLNEKPDMIGHFNWIILRERRRKGLTQERLAEAVKLPVEYIELLEKGNVPNNIEILRKLENFFNISLVKKNIFEDIEEEHPILLDEYGNELDHIPEPDVEEKFSEDEYTDKLLKKESEEDFDIHKADIKKVSLKDLMELHRKKLLGKEDYDAESILPKQVLHKVEVFEKENEKVSKASVNDKKDKQNISEARKEEFKLLREKQSRELDNILGGSELLSVENSGDKIYKESGNKIDRLFDEAFGE